MNGADYCGLIFGELDHLAPFLGFVGDQFAELGGRHRHRDAAEIGDAFLDLGVGEAGGDLAVELGDDIGRRVLRRADALPGEGLIAGHEIGHRRQIRQDRMRVLLVTASAAQPAGADMFDREDDLVEQHLHLTAEQVGDGRRVAAIGHMQHVDAGHHLEQFAGQMRRRADAAGRHIDFARMRLGIGDEFGNAMHRQRRIDHQDLAD